MSAKLLNQLTNLARTENGALGYKSTLNACLDFFFQTVPRMPESTLRDSLARSWSESPLTSLKLLFQLRDVRRGKNDRHNFYKGMNWLMENHPRTLMSNLEMIPVVGCWKDLLRIPVAHVYQLLPEPKKPEFKRYDSFREKRQEKDRRIAARQVKPLTKEERSDIIRKDLEWQKSIIRAHHARLREHRDKVLADNPLIAEMVEKIACMFYDQLKLDLESMKQGKYVSLAAKWAPSQHRNHDRLLGITKRIALKFFPLDENLAKTKEDVLAWEVKAKHRLQKEILAPLRRYTPVTEVFMCAKEWDAVHYPRVHSQCMQINEKRFRKYDKERFLAYLADVAQGKSTITAGAVLPHTIIRCKNEVGEQQWNRYVADLKAQGALDGVLPVCDVSDSMTGEPMDVCIALGLLASSLAKPPFERLVCTFSQRPQFVRLPEGSLQDQVQELERIDWGCNTDFEAVFNLILERAQAASIPPEDMIKKVLVLSDMQFDQSATDMDWTTTHERIQAKFQKAGYPLPAFIYWNLRHTRGAIPATASQPGITMLSGFSGKLMQLLLDNSQDMGAKCSEEIMLEALNVKGYERLQVVD